MPLNHDRDADRLIHQAAAEPDPERSDRLIALAQAHATLAVADQAELENLIAVLRILGDGVDFLEFPDAALIIRRQIRRRLRLFPPLTTDGEDPNGGA